MLHQAHNTQRSPQPQQGATTDTALDATNSRRTPTRILRLAEVVEITGLCKTTIYELQAAGEFPTRVKITGSSVGWVESDVQHWIVSRIPASVPARAPRQSR